MQNSDKSSLKKILIMDIKPKLISIGISLLKKIILKNCIEMLVSKEIQIILISDKVSKVGTHVTLDRK